MPREEKKRRLHELERLQHEIATRKNAALEGAIVEVLVEGPSARRPSESGASNSTLGEEGAGATAPAEADTPSSTRWGGRTRTNKLVFFDAPYDPTGQTVKVLVTKTSPWFLEGQTLTPAPVRSRKLPVLA